MPSVQHLSPDYGLSPIRLGEAGEAPAWPGLLLHSPHLTWVFDPQSRPLDDLDDVRGLATAAGLHPVGDPFSGELLDAAEPWTFQLPTPRRLARLTGPGLVIDINRTPRILDDWWRASILHGARCRMLIAVCVAFLDDSDPAGFANVLAGAALDGRVFGATIGVEFL